MHAGDHFKALWEGGNLRSSMKEHLQYGCWGAIFAGKGWEETGTTMATSGVNASPGDTASRFA